ncbi:hypothetical protein QVE09_26490 [Paenibacillus sp. ClWae2A]|uniref:hypothetical protein n=1 Tax=Paenibacillus sp. ClWae2A TaxID=3057177 RepID=UPI0028F6683B|nr:hypothetical protein [Paenibacillus sp. ClWae2A]MDT9722455.1 hypothetical protein [Paenibacillus sp. ClWae2A]
MNISFPVPHELTNKVDILLERIPYLSEVITGMCYNDIDKVILLTTVELDMNSPEIIELSESYLDLCASLEKTRIIKRRVIRSNLDSDNSNRISAKYIDVESLPYMDESDIILIGNLDEVFVQIAKKYGAELREYSSVLSKSNMIRNQYHIHFPQNIYGVTRVSHNYRAIKKFRNKALIESYEESIAFHGEILQPCICYHCYEELQGKLLTQGKILTGKGKCFRNEIEWRKDKYRHSEFTMREIVFVGEKEWVVNTRDRIMDEVWSFFDSIGLKGKIENATDPFFFSQDLKTKGTYQLISNAKYELIVTTLNCKRSSIASFNYCQDTLCSKYEIKDQNESALFSGCIAFGIERWKEAFIDLHGRDMKNWPRMSIRKET